MNPDVTCTEVRNRRYFRHFRSSAKRQFRYCTSHGPNMKTLVAYVYVGLFCVAGRVSTLRLVGCGFDPRPGHIKASKMAPQWCPHLRDRSVQWDCRLSNSVFKILALNIKHNWFTRVCQTDLCSNIQKPYFDASVVSCSFSNLGKCWNITKNSTISENYDQPYNL